MYALSTIKRRVPDRFQERTRAEMAFHIDVLAGAMVAEFEDA